MTSDRDKTTDENGDPVGTKPDAAAGPGKGVDPSVQGSIGELLRQHFDELVAEPLPEEIRRLWDELNRKQRD